MVPKVGVEGRPAGAIDVLATIPGYSVDLDVSEVMRILTENSYVHVLARRFVPLDQQLFAFRKEHDAIDVPPLAIASLLSKKVAVGLERAGLDVRVARHGNFGESLAIASANASRFCRVAALLGIEATCVLTDARRPYQPFLGRGESLVAIDGILQGSSDPWLDGHANLCWHISCEAAGASEGTPPSGDVLKELFSRNLQAQGSSMSAFDERVDFIKNADRVALEAHRDGYVHIDLGQLRSALLQLQESGGGDPDPAGVILRFEPDSPLSRGDLIAEVRHPGKTDEIGTIASAFTILDDLSIRPFSPQVVRNV
jgi:pyrimidine-nucleoside phosphorylase